jgi:hypothetical protein
VAHRHSPWSCQSSLVHFVLCVSPWSVGIRGCFRILHAIRFRLGLTWTASKPKFGGSNLCFVPSPRLQPLCLGLVNRGVNLF